MIRLNRIWIISGLALMVLAACSNSTLPTAKNSSVATTSPATTDSTANSKATFADMHKIVYKTTSAVNASNFDQARQDFKNFDEGYWSKVEDGVKDKSADTYKQIEDEMDDVTNGLRVAKPDKTKVLASLQSLSKTLDSYTRKY